MSIMVNIGFNNMVTVQRIVAIVSPDSSPCKRIIAHARENNKLVDATHGRRTRSAVICDNGHVILSSLQPQTINDRASRDIELIGEQG